MTITDKLKTIAENEQKVYEAGREKGHSEGYIDAFNMTYDKCSSRDKFPDEFWDKYFFTNGDGFYYTDYSWSGGGTFRNWSAYQFTPPAPISFHLNQISDEIGVKTSAFEAFRNFNNAGINGKPYKPNFTLKGTQSYKDIGVSLSHARDVRHIFMSAVIDTLDKISFFSADYADLAFYSSEIRCITNFYFPTYASIDGMFDNCSMLEVLTLAHTSIIEDNNLNLQWSTKLTHESLINILNHLKDKSADTSGTKWKITIGRTNLAKLTEEELSIAWDKGWEVV